MLPLKEGPVKNVIVKKLEITVLERTLTNEQEYCKYGANPFMKDIFVEVDWMKKEIEGR